MLNLCWGGDLVDEVLKKLNIFDLKNRKASKLSTGQKQRVSIARAIVKKPKVLLCDEPTGNLDFETSKLILDVLKEISKDILVVIISHNNNESYKYAKRIIKLNKGEIIDDIETKYKDISYLKENNTLYLNDINSLNDDELYEINNNIKSNEIDNIKPSKTLFKKTAKYKYLKDNITLKKDHVSNKNIFHFFKDILGKSISRMALLVCITVAILSLFGICEMAYNFDVSSIALKQIEKTNLNVIPFVKHPISEKDSRTWYLDSFSEDEIKDFKNSDCDLIVNYSFRKRGITTFTDFIYDKGMINNNDETIYNSINFGICVTSEKHFKTLFEIDNINYLFLADEIKDGGIYLTDYQADKIMYLNSDIDYKDLVGTLKNSNIVENYVNGIIDTKYKERFNNLFNDEIDIDSLDTASDEYSEFILYARNHLEYSYSFNENFLNDFSSFEYKQNFTVESINFEGITGDSDNDFSLSEKYCFSRNAKESLDFEDKLTDGICISDNTLNTKLNLNYTVDELNKYLENKEVTLNIINMIGNKYSFKVSKVSAFSNNNPSSNYVYFGDDIFNEILSTTLFYYGAICYDKSKAVELNNKYYSSGILCNISSVTLASKLGDFILSYADLFKFISYILIVVCCLMFLFVSYDSVKKKKYEIGVLKALGCSIKHLYKIYFINYLIEILFSITFYFVFINVFKVCCNFVLVAALESKTAYSGYFDGISIFSLTPSIISIDLIIMFIFLLLGFLIPLFKIKNIKPIEIIRNKY